MPKPAKNRPVAIPVTFEAPVAPQTTTNYELPDDQKRVLFYVEHISGANVLMAFGGETQALNSYTIQAGRQLPAFDNPDSCPKGTIAFSATAAAQIVIIVATQVDG